MLRILNIARIRGAALFGALLVSLGIAACQRVPLLAPTGSVITLTALTTALPVNGTTQLIVQVLEAAGTPPHSGTHVIFTTTLGSIEPSEAQTDINGRAVATFKAGTANGTATIIASSGGASVAAANALKIAVGTAAVGRVVVSASPTLIPAVGGAAVITAAVSDINGNPLSSAPVSFTTTAGSLDVTGVNTDADGIAKTTLRTSTQATVTASVGAQGGSSTGGGTTGGGTTGGGTTGGGNGTTAGQASGTVTVNVSGAPTIVITPPATQPNAGLPASYTFAVTAAATNGSPVREVVVNWGDGTSQNLGSVSGSAVVSHTYRSAGSYTITATVTDAFGNVVPVSTGVTVVATSLPLTVTAPATPPGVGLPATFTITIGTLPPGDAVQNVRVDWGDSTSQNLGAVTGNTSITHVYQEARSYNVTVTLNDTAGNSASVGTSVTVVATATPTIIITPSVPTGSKTATFQIQVTPPSGVGIQSAQINFGDGVTAQLGGLTGTTTVQHTYPNIANQTYTVTLTVVDTLGRTTTGTTTVNIP